MSREVDGITYATTVDEALQLLHYVTLKITREYPESAKRQQDALRILAEALQAHASPDQASTAQLLDLARSVLTWPVPVQAKALLLIREVTRLDIPTAARLVGPLGWR